MAGDYKRERFSRSIGTGGAHDEMDIITHGQKRFTVSKDEPAFTGEAVSATPAAPKGRGKGTFFFRDRGDGKAQFVVRFPSGAEQILATEPD